MGADTGKPGTPYDNIPIEVRRANWGWFGEPWWSYICYDEDGQLIAEMRKPFPVGENCLHCDEPFSEEAGDSGQAMPCMKADRTGGIRHVHKECQFMEVAGPLAHHERTCRCYGGETAATPGMTRRQEALEVWRRLEAGVLFNGNGHR
jgi:hypothetical protein